MASAIDTATAERDATPAAPRPRRRSRRRGSGRAVGIRLSRRRAGPGSIAALARSAVAAAVAAHIAADAPHRRGQRPAAGAARARLSLSRQVRGEPDRTADRVAADAGRDLRRRAQRGRRARLGRRRRDPAPRTVAPDDAPSGRADPHARPAVRHAGQADRGQPRAARARRPGAGRPNCRRRKGLLSRLVDAVCDWFAALSPSGRKPPIYRGGRNRRGVSGGAVGAVGRGRLGGARATRRPAGW